MTWLNWPNRITIARILLVVPLVIGLMNLRDGGATPRRLTLLLFGVLAACDALDGFLARRLKQETALGRFLDPLGDKLLVTCAVVILAVPATAVEGCRLPGWVPVIAIGKEVVTVAGFALIYLSTGRLCTRPRRPGKMCTLSQMVMIAAILISPDLPAGVRDAIPALWYTASALAIWATGDYIRMGNRFAASASEPDEGER